MSMITCPDCGQQISKRAPKCPLCGRPQARKMGCLLQSIIAIIIIIVGFVWWMTTGLQQQTNQTMTTIRNQVADDAVTQYNIAAKQGDKMQKCVQAGFAAAAFLQAQDSANYASWKDIEKADCRAAGIRK